MGKIKKLLKNYKISIPVGLLIVIIGSVAFAKSNNEPKEDFVTATRTTIVQEIDVTGRVTASEEVELAVESGGKISSIPVSIGQRVGIGQILLRVDSSDLQIRLGRQQAALDKAKIALAKQEPKTNAQDDLTKAYEDGFNAVADAFLDLPTIILGVDDILGQSYLSSNTIRSIDGDRAVEMRSDVVQNYYAAKTQYNNVLRRYRAASRQSDKATIEALINDTYEVTKRVADAVKKTNNFVDYLEDELDESAPAELNNDQDTLDTYTDETNTHLSSLLAITDTIKDSREGVTDEGLDISSARIDVKQAELDVQDTLNQISERSIRSPINGVVTDIAAEIGETISAGDPVVTVISSNQYQIEANLPEADVAKVKVGADVEVTLDAYGSDVLFEAKVVSVNPAETLIDGVATYKTTIQFVKPDDRIKSGMTADVLIKGDSKPNVIAIPQRAVIIKDDKKTVRVLVGEEIVEKPVETGMRGTDGNIEIIKGIVEGDKVIVFVEKK